MLLKNDFAWNWAIRIGELVSTFRCWQFSPSSFFAQKNTTKKLIFLCFFFTNVNSSQKAISFQVFLNSWQFVAASWCKDMEWKYIQKWMFLKSAKIIRKFWILSTITYGNRKTPTFQKQWKRCENRKGLYVQRSKWDSFLDTNGKLISWWEEFCSVKWKHKKINFFVVFFVKETMKAKIVNNEKH